jgi:hypothetical protein
MKMLVKRTALAASVALATLIAAHTAYAQPHHAAPETHDTRAVPHAAAPPNAAMSGNRQIGVDPDPFIRGEMLRHSDSGWPD